MGEVAFPQVQAKAGLVFGGDSRVCCRQLDSGPGVLVARVPGDP